MAVSASCAWQAAPARLARLQRRCFSDEEKAVLCHSNAGDEGYFKRNFQRGRRTRVEMMQQISSAHDQMRVFYELGRQNLMAKGRLTPDEAARFARIDERLFKLQKEPLQLEFYQRHKQFHEDYIRKRFALGKEEE
ncbi:unnamed protein product [Effrenium voratum]|uniref:Uncharacterized protein n=1 Tax=Effrenium voratum TaxID=2562239 RepID=A0AA36MIJ5_9DINO|nr:unnamed protein product [Effrenium voratum]CAJ1419584.1 unnamed protein product [Effrenium voratum]